MIGQGSVTVTVASRTLHSQSTITIIPKNPTPTKSPVLLLSPVGGVPGYVVEFPAEIKIQTSGYMCTGSEPNPCASTQPCNLPTNQVGVVQVPVQLSGAPLSGGSPGAFAIAPNEMEGSSQSLCYEGAQVGNAYKPANGSFPAVAVTADCSKIPTCQAVQKTVDDNIDFSAGPGEGNDTETYKMKFRICFNDDSDCPTLKIADADSGNVLSDASTPESDKSVGQLIKLKIVTDPPGQEGSSENLQWTLPDAPVAIKDYTLKGDSPAFASASVTPLGPSDLTNQQEVDFYWTAGGSQTVRLSGDVKTGDGLLWPSSAEADYDVQRPQITNFPLQNPGANLLPASKQPSCGGAVSGYPVIQVGLSGTLFSADVQGVAQSPGKIAFVQLAFPGREIRTAAGTQPIGRSGVDTVGPLPPFYGADPKAPVMATIGSGSAHLDNWDSPCVSIAPDFLGINIKDSFADYLMYKPIGTDSIWVTLAVASWDWGASWDRQNPQQLTSPSTGSDSNGADSTLLPTWSCVADPAVPPGCP